MCSKRTLNGERRLRFDDHVTIIGHSSQDNVSSYVHDQGSDGTCYAHACASAVMDALMRAGVNPLPHRRNVVENLIGHYGVDGANSAKALEWACRRYLSGHGGLLRCLPFQCFLFKHSRTARSR